MSTAEEKREARKRSPLLPFRRAVLRGLGLVLPPLLTIVIFVWIGSTVNQYVLQPVLGGSRHVLTWWELSRYPEFPRGEDRIVNGETQLVTEEGQVFARTSEGIFVPIEILETVREDDPDYSKFSESRSDIFRRYVEIVYLRPHRFIPIFLCVFVVFLYLLGKFLAAGVGRVFLNFFEWLIRRLPVVRNVYGSVKQVTDFMINQSEFEYGRVVAVEYPRIGIWSIGFVTGESLFDVRRAAGESVLSIMVPCSPMSLTGYTIMVRKSETIDLHMTVDQGLQFIISCGVIVPPHQLPPSRRLVEDSPLALEGTATAVRATSAGDAARA